MAAYEVLEDASVRVQVAPLKVGDTLPEMPVFLVPRKFVRLPLETTHGQAFRSVPRKFREPLEAILAMLPLDRNACCGLEPSMIARGHVAAPLAKAIARP